MPSQILPRLSSPSPWYPLFSAPQIILPDAGTCAFPGGWEQPDSIKPLFADKAITLLHDYITIAADDILLRLEDTQSRHMVSSDDITLRSTDHQHTLMYFAPDPSDYNCRRCNESFKGERYHCAMCKYDMCENCAKKTMESIETDAFLR